RYLSPLSGHDEIDIPSTSAAPAPRPRGAEDGKPVGRSECSRTIRPHKGSPAGDGGAFLSMRHPALAIFNPRSCTSFWAFDHSHSTHVLGKHGCYTDRNKPSFHSSCQSLVGMTVAPRATAMTIAHAYTLLLEAAVFAASFGILWLRDRRRPYREMQPGERSHQPLVDLVSEQQDGAKHGLAIGSVA